MWTLIYNNQEDRVSTFGLVSSSTRIRVSTKFSKSYSSTTSGRQLKFVSFLLPANKVCEGYVFTPVCQSFCSQGVCLLRGVPAPRGGACSQGGVCSQGDLLRGGLLLGGGLLLVECLLRGGCGDPPEMATAAGGTHPTGMHSCSCCFHSIQNRMLSLL